MPFHTLSAPRDQVVLTRRRIAPYLWPTLAILLLAAVNVRMGMSEFGGYDLSPLIDAAWRVQIGQIPNLSFICTYPPSVYLPVEVAFRWFGPHWVLLPLAEDVVYLLLCLAGLRLCWILGSRQPERPAYALAWMYIGIQTIPLLSVNHIWHSTTASALAAYGVLASYTLLSLATTGSRWEVTAHVAVALAGLALSKPNVALPAILLFTVCLTLDKRCRKLILPMLLIAAVADLLALRAFHITFLEVLRGYLQASGRARPFLFFVGIAPEKTLIGAITVPITYYLLTIPALSLIATLRRHRQFWAGRGELLCVGAGFITLAGLATNWELKLVDAPAFLTGCAVAATMIPDRFARVLRPAKWSIALFCLFAAALGAARTRMWLVGPWAGPAYGPEVTIHDSFFGAFETRQAFADLLREVDTVVSHSRDERIFFGPRMEFLYARERIASPLDLPIWWHLGTSYAISQESNVENNWEKDHFELLIFAKGDRTRFPARLLANMDSEYTFDGHWKTIDVFYRR